MFSRGLKRDQWHEMVKQLICNHHLVLNFHPHTALEAFMISLNVHYKLIFLRKIQNSKNVHFSEILQWYRKKKYCVSI